MKTRIFMLLVLFFMVTPVHAGKRVKIYDENSRWVGTVENGRIYDNNYHYRGRIEKDKIYDENSRYRGRLQTEKDAKKRQRHREDEDNE
ncbi:MAG: hypothetical protein KKD99_08910 [Proteobacteria bacterium]|nr:hypothetical protein [Pseudomonadota bacterium]MBU4448693.1 hypothetical protein [Pseudomonadota bacterium]